MLPVCQILNRQNFACQFAKMFFLGTMYQMTYTIAMKAINVFMLFWIFHFLDKQVFIITATTLDNNSVNKINGKTTNMTLTKLDAKNLKWIQSHLLHCSIRTDFWNHQLSIKFTIKWKWDQMYTIGKYQHYVIHILTMLMVLRFSVYLNI